VECIVKRKKSIFIFFIVSLGIAIIYNLLIGKNYEANAVVRIGSGVEHLFVTKADACHKIQSRKFLDNVFKKYKLEINYFEHKFSVESEDIPRYPDLILIKVRYPDLPLAVKICNSLAEEFVTEENELYIVNSDLLKKQIEDLKKDKISLISGRAGLADAASRNEKDKDKIYTYLAEKKLLLEKKLLYLKDFEIVENAISAKDCLSDKRQKNLVVIPLIGVMASIFMAVFKRSLEKSMDT
jgi:capsular polysaccharide biosynthesis protein